MKTARFPKQHLLFVLLGNRLRNAYDEVAAQELPEKIKRALEQLQEQERGHAANQRRAG